MTGLPDLQVGNITHTNILATVRLVAQFCVAVHKEYQCLRREVRALRAESHSLSERLSQQLCNTTGDAPRIDSGVELPESGARNRSDSEFSENNDSFDSGASGTNSGGADENIQPHVDNEAGASESGAKNEIHADVHANGASKSSKTESSGHTIEEENDSSDGCMNESQTHEKPSSTTKKRLGRTIRIAPSNAKRRLLENGVDSNQAISKAKDGDIIITKVCEEIAKTLEDDERSNSSESSFEKWCPVFKLPMETPPSRGSSAAKRRSRESTDRTGSDAKSGRETKPNSGSKAVRSATKLRDTRKSKTDSSDEAERSDNSENETKVAKRRKSASSSGKLLRRLSNSQTVKSKGFLRIKMKSKMSNRNNKQSATGKKVMGPRKRKLSPNRKLNRNASDGDNQDDTDDELTDIDTPLRHGDSDIHITNCSVVIDDDISPLTVSAAKKRHKSNQKQKSPRPLLQDLGDESDLGGAIKLWDAGYIWQLSGMLRQMLDEGGETSLTFAAAKITNDTRSRLAEMLCQTTSFKWDADTKTIKKQHSSRPPGARDMEEVLRRIRHN